MIREFEKREGRFVYMIPGQNRLGYSMTDTEDFYDLIGWAEIGGYRGSVIRFHDMENGKVYEPFEIRRNTLYGQPVYLKGYYYFLKGNYDEKMVWLYRYQPESGLEEIAAFNMNEIDLYNLRVCGEGVNVISQNDVFRCYYPKQFSFKLEPHETVCLIDNDRVYLESWVEEGWDEQENRPTENYRYYDEVVIKDLDGNLIEKKPGSLSQAYDGTWWIG